MGVGLRWREWEPTILDRWGSRENFIAEKADALPTLHDEILEWVFSDSSAAVLETTGLSDAPLLAALDRSAAAVMIVRLDVSEEEALRRVAGRARGRHLSDDVELNRGVWRAFHEHVLPQRHVDLVVDTENQSIATAVAVIAAALTG